MKRSRLLLALLGFSLGVAGLQGCVHLDADAARHSIVGTWMVRDPNAPFPYHLYVFNADGTVHQANPDAGDPRTSDSDGKGAWTSDGARIVGRWVELLADRSSHLFLGRLEVSFAIDVSGDTLSGTETVRTFDADGVPTGNIPTPARITGQRITPR